MRSVLLVLVAISAVLGAGTAAAANGVKNDERQNATSIVVGSTRTQATQHATQGVGDWCYVGACSNTVWYSFRSPRDGWYSLNTYGSSYDTFVSVFGDWRYAGRYGDAVIAWNDDTIGLQSEVWFYAERNTVHNIMIGSYTGTGGMLTVNMPR